MSYTGSVQKCMMLPNLDAIELSNMYKCLIRVVHVGETKKEPRASVGPAHLTRLVAHTKLETILFTLQACLLRTRMTGSDVSHLSLHLVCSQVVLEGELCRTRG